MSDTTEAAVQRVRNESPIVDEACRFLENMLDPGDPRTVIDFAEIFFSKASRDFLSERTAEELARVTFGAFEFLRESRADRVDVQVLNPDEDVEGWYAPVTVIRTNVSERPFIVDTIREYLHAQGLPIEHNVYPVIDVRRDESGDVVEVGPSFEGRSRESLVHCEVPRITDADRRAEIESEIRSRLEDAVAATDDFHRMIDAVNDTVTELEETADVLESRRHEMEEAQAFLRWLRDGAFVFLGYREYRIEDAEGGRQVRVDPESGLGILRDPSESTFADPVPLDELPPGIRELAEGGPILIISKTNAESTVHRRARMDYVGVKTVGDDGRIVGERRFIGLFTSKAYGEPAEAIPILREKLQRILESAGVQEGSHDYKEINTIFNSMPKEELLLGSSDEIAVDIQTILTSYNTEGVRVSVRPDPLARGSSVMVILPKERFSGEVRKWIEELLVDRLDGEVLNYHLALGTGDQARLHFYMGPRDETLRPVAPAELEADLRELIRSWQDRIETRLEDVRSPDEARRLARRYGEGFSPEYQAAVRPERAVTDILELEAMAAEGREVSILFAEPDGNPPTLQDNPVSELNLYLRGQRLVLSDFMPILESLGLRVIAVSPFEVKGAGVGSAAIYSFAVQDARGRPLDIEAHGELLGESVLAIREGRTSCDSLNGLVMQAGLHWREVDVVRAFAAYAFQMQAVPSRSSIPSALGRYPQMARTFVEWFSAKFEPREDGGEGRGGDVRIARARYLSGLGSVDALTDDRALRRLGVLLDAAVRTNYHRCGGRTPTRESGGAPYISIKFESQKLSEIQKSRLTWEVWVRSARMEGVHLRGSSVARGGIRWSDRPDDFRTEVLGLVKTQMVKNAVIVPGGSKGGFVLLAPPEDPEERAEAGKAQYQTLQRGLLDLTDNLDAEGELSPPPDVVCWDDPDPYLVVAADKGTAKFSDVANAVSDEYGFWLQDAYASGGSNGYDHKVVGITARGAWECVKRHFRELGKNIQEEPFTVAGIGDMSGDVFGNGMLLSKQIRLIAAFDHRHIFLDPDPDPAVSWEERKRMFDLGRSSWDDYDRSKLSRGGQIVPRGSKEVVLSPEAIEALGLPEDTDPLDGESLIRVILTAPVELLWNGGIGTYVKSTSETHAIVGDAANDAVRIDAPELRCKVVGEGGNLGLTQSARIEYALRGGRINTDALDNSGGVDLSDREVNLKILLSRAVRQGDLPWDERNQLLEDLTEEVADGVLHDNWSQSLAVSLDELRQTDGIDDFRDLMVGLERAGLLDRYAEYLPTLEVLVERSEVGEGLQRPELCVLLAYAKLQVKGALVDSDLPDEPELEPYIMEYFPDAAIERAGQDAVSEHRLRREIVTSQLTNDLVDLMGATFVHRIARDTGRSVRDIVAAWLVAARLAEHTEIMRHLSEMGPGLSTADSYRWLLGLSRVLERTTRWVLDHFHEGVHPGELIRENVDGVRQLQSSFRDIVAGPDREMYEERVRALMEIGADERLASELLTLRFLDQLLEILHISRDEGSPPSEVGMVFYRVSDRLGIPWLRTQIEQTASDDRWEQRAAAALAGDLTRAHHRITAYALQRTGGAADPGEAASRVMEERRREMERLRQLLEEIRSENEMSLAGLSVAVREIAALADRSETG